MKSQLDFLMLDSVVEKGKHTEVISILHVAFLITVPTTADVL